MQESENVENGKTGFVVSRRNPEALAVCMRKLAADPDLRQQMGERGRTRVQTRFRG
jgi:glycosyltransferase involved in cell wall biosynthesis